MLRAGKMPCRVEICVIYARNLVTRRGIAGSLMSGRGRTLTGSTEVTLVILCYNCGKSVIFHGNVEENRETREGEEMEVLTLSLAKTHNLSNETRYGVMEGNVLRKLQEEDEVLKEMIKWIVDGRVPKMQEVREKYRK